MCYGRIWGEEDKFYSYYSSVLLLKDKSGVMYLWSFYSYYSSVLLLKDNSGVEEGAFQFHLKISCNQVLFFE